MLSATTAFCPFPGATLEHPSEGPSVLERTASERHVGDSVSWTVTLHPGVPARDALRPNSFVVQRGGPGLTVMYRTVGSPFRPQTFTSCPEFAEVLDAATVGLHVFSEVSRARCGDTHSEEALRDLALDFANDTDLFQWPAAAPRLAVSPLFFACISSD